MNEILSWLGWAAVGLLAAAVVVAGWEHLVREAQGQRTDCGAAPQRTAHMPVDVPLDTASAALLPDLHPPAAPPAPAPITEAAARLVAVTQALSRAAHPGRASHDGGRWMDTTPRIVGLNEPALGERGARARPGDRAASNRGEPGSDTQDDAKGLPHLPHLPADAPPPERERERERARGRDAAPSA